MERNPNQRAARNRGVIICPTYASKGKKALPCAVHDGRAFEKLLLLYGVGQDAILRVSDDAEFGDIWPSRNGILNALCWLSEDAIAGDSLFFFFSGHATSVFDPLGDEEDGCTEVLCALERDNETVNYVLDDEVFDILVRPLPYGARMLAVVDACHSGTVLDLPFVYRYVGRDPAGGWWADPLVAKRCRADVVLIAATDDLAFTDDAENSDSPMSWFSRSFVDTISSGWSGTWLELIQHLNEKLAPTESAPVVQLSASCPIPDFLNDPFSFRWGVRLGSPANELWTRRLPRIRAGLAGPCRRDKRNVPLRDWGCAISEVKTLKGILNDLQADSEEPSPERLRDVKSIAVCLSPSETSEAACCIAFELGVLLSACTSLQTIYLPDEKLGTVQAFISGYETERASHQAKSPIETRAVTAPPAAANLVYCSQDVYDKHITSSEIDGCIVVPGQLTSIVHLLSIAIPRHRTLPAVFINAKGVFDGLKDWLRRVIIERSTASTLAAAFIFVSHTGAAYSALKTIRLPELRVGTVFNPPKIITGSSWAWRLGGDHTFYKVRINSPSLSSYHKAVDDGAKALPSGHYPLVIRNVYSSVCGSDVGLWKRYVPGEVTSWTGCGDGFSGHEVVGVVQESSSLDVPVGTAVVALPPSYFRAHASARPEWYKPEVHEALTEAYWPATGGFASSFLSSTLTCVPVDSMDTRWLLVQPLATVLRLMKRLVHRAVVIQDATVAVLGCGQNGLLAIALLRALGAKTIVALEPIASRREAAIKVGADHSIDVSNYTDSEIADSLKSLVGDLPSLVCEFVGHNDTSLNTAINIAQHAGTVALFGVPDSTFLDGVAIGSLFRRNITLIGSVFPDPAVDLAHALCILRGDQSGTAEYWHQFSGKLISMSLINIRGVVDLATLVSVLFTHKFDTHELQRVFQTCSDPPKGFIKCVVQW